MINAQIIRTEEFQNQIGFNILEVLSEFSEYLLNNSDPEHFLLSFDLFEFLLMLFPECYSQIIKQSKFNKFKIISLN